MATLIGTGPWAVAKKNGVTRCLGGTGVRRGNRSHLLRRGLARRFTRPTVRTERIQGCRRTACDGKRRQGTVQTASGLGGGDFVASPARDRDGRDLRPHRIDSVDVNFSGVGELL